MISCCLLAVYAVTPRGVQEGLKLLEPLSKDSFGSQSPKSSSPHLFQWELFPKVSLQQAALAKIVEKAERQEEEKE